MSMFFLTQDRYIYGNVLQERSVNFYSPIVTFPDGWLAAYCAFS